VEAWQAVLSWALAHQIRRGGVWWSCGGETHRWPG
jgi:hypothetical protein